MTPELRRTLRDIRDGHLAVILDTGRDHANRLTGPADAPLVAALSAMTEMAVDYAAQPDGGTLFPIDDMFAQLAERHQ